MSDIYTGLSGMISYENRLNTIGNNLANVRTTGYKKDVDTMKVFEESFMRIQHQQRDERIGVYHNQVHTDQVYTKYDQGNLQMTNRMLDLALVDNANSETVSFIEVEHNGGTYLTRDGSLQVNGEGDLNTADGSYVLNANGGRINLEGVREFAVSPEGIITNAETGEFIDQIRVRSVHQENVGLLEKFGHNKFQVMSMEKFINQFGPLENILENYDNNAGLQRLFDRETILEMQQTGQMNVFEPINAGEVLQGALEQSNVDIGKSMTDLMIAQKGYSANAKTLTVMDQINEKDSNQLGS